MYKELRFDKVLETTCKLQDRVTERFPESGISRVCCELNAVANESKQTINDLLKPNLWVRGAVLFTIFAFLTMLVYTASIVGWEFNKPNLTDIIQITEALINDILLLGAALYFLITFERRLKRKSILQALHQLRSIAHVIDMHQLTKDPSMMQSHTIRTINSPVRNLSEFELQRYLDYCSEMFSLIGKIAALFSEKMPEPEIVSAANDIENLCTGLSRKVWQKMVLLDEKKLASSV